MNRKEHVSETAKSVVRRNVKQKLMLLDTWIADGVPLLTTDNGIPIRDDFGEVQLDFYPKNPFAFAAWDGSQNCNTVRIKYDIEFKLISRETLNKPYHGELKRDALKKLSALSERAAQQAAILNKQAIIKALERDIQEKDDLIARQDTEIVKGRIDAQALEVDFRKLSRAFENGKEEHQRIVEELNKKVADLTLQLSKFVLLKLKGKGV